MRTAFLLAFCAFLWTADNSLGQGRGAATQDFQLTKINRNLTSTPEFAYSGSDSGGRGYDVDRDARWLQVEAEFSAAPEFTDELTFRYFVLINGKLLSGEVTHVNILAGRENRSVMYVPPNVLARFVANRVAIENSIQNVAVQLVQAGAVKSELSFGRAAPHWFASLPKIAGGLLNKNETPFAPLYWDRYEQIKTPGR